MCCGRGSLGRGWRGDFAVKILTEFYVRHSSSLCTPADCLVKIFFRDTLVYSIVCLFSETYSCRLSHSYGGTKFFSQHFHFLHNSHTEKQSISSSSLLVALANSLLQYVASSESRSRPPPLALARASESPSRRARYIHSVENIICQNPKYIILCRSSYVRSLLLLSVLVLLLNVL